MIGCCDHFEIRTLNAAQGRKFIIVPKRVVCSADVPVRTVISEDHSVLLKCSQDHLHIWGKCTDVVIRLQSNPHSHRRSVRTRCTAGFMCSRVDIGVTCRNGSETKGMTYL